MSSLIGRARVRREGAMEQPKKANGGIVAFLFFATCTMHACECKKKKGAVLHSVDENGHICATCRFQLYVLRNNAAYAKPMQIGT